MAIRLDFAAIGKPEDFKIRLALIFTEPEHQATAVTKCMNCIGTQEKLRKTPYTNLNLYGCCLLLIEL
jgi:hypothetical protein